MNRLKNRILPKKRDKIRDRIKFIAVLSSLFTIFHTSILLNSVYAKNINSAYIYSTGDCGDLLIYKGIGVKTTYVQYDNNGISCAQQHRVKGHLCLIEQIGMENYLIAMLGD